MNTDVSESFLPVEQRLTLRVNVKSPTSQATQESMDYVQPNFRESSNRAHWFLFGGNGAVVKMILKGRSSTCVIFRGCISCEL